MVNGYWLMLFSRKGYRMTPLVTTPFKLLSSLSTHQCSYPSIESLALDSGVHIGNALMWLPRLESHGLIKVHERGNGHGKPRRVQLLVNDPARWMVIVLPKEEQDE